MKNKILLYILIPLTILLWGSIIFKIFNSYFGSDEIANQIPNSYAENNDQLVLVDTFSIGNNYPDPFLGKVTTSPILKEGTAVSAKSVKAKNTHIPIAIIWPEISYKGIIKNQKSSKQLALVEINGHGNTMWVGESYNDIVLTKVFKDSIEVKYGKERKYIKK